MALQTIRGHVAINWHVTAPTNLNAPSVAGDAIISAPTDVLKGTGSDGECLQSMSPWQKDVSTISIPSACSLQTSTIPGPQVPGQDSLTYYFDDTTTPIKDLFTPGTTGYLLFAPYGATAGQRSSVCLVEVLSNQIDYEIANQGATFTVTFSKTSQTEGRIVA